MEDDDLQELKLIFLDECLENIELLENGLMRMTEGDSSSDTLNEVFRAAHSIKGGAATFGFTPMSELTHYMETLLDEMRAERRPVVDTDVDLLLSGLDIVQQILEASRSGETADHDERQNLQIQLQQSVDGAEPEQSADIAPAEEAGQTVNDLSWIFSFKPNIDFVLRGNDPLLLLREVARLGELELTLISDDLPDWEDLDPRNCYASWTGRLVGSATEADIREIFEWVEEDCTLTVEEAETQAPQSDSNAPAKEADNVSDPSTIPTQSKSESSQTAATASDDNAKPEKDNKSDKANAAAAKNKQPTAGSESSSIRISTEKIDHLINMVGELVITQSMLSRVGNQLQGGELEELRERLDDLEHHTRDLQESVMQVRMLPLSSAFSRIPRLVRDLSRKLDKQVDLVLEGGTTELDKTVLERMIDPLVHLIRNSLDHGLETPQERIEANKPELGRLVLNASQESGNVIITITDDGRGINSERILAKAKAFGIVDEKEELTVDQINQLIFAPGFSTAETVSDVSGRGVGMDVVRRNILDLGGRVHVHSELGIGTTVEIRLPLSLAILDGQLVRIGEQIYVIPILSIVETVETRQTELGTIPDSGDVCRFRGTYLPIVNVAKQFQIETTDIGRMVVIVETHKQRTGLLVDEVLSQQQVVIKPLDKNYKPVSGLAGATIMSDGSVALILDPNGFVVDFKTAA